MNFETKRLILRELNINDVEALYKVLGDKSIMQYYPYSFDKQKVNEWILKNIQRYETFGFGLWAVCLKNTGELIGDCGLTMQNINGVDRPEIGYHIRKDMQRKGYAKEAAIAVRDWTFAYGGFDTVYSYMNFDNLASAKTAISYGCNFLQEYENEEHIQIKVYALTRKRWYELTITRKYQKEILEYLRKIPKGKVTTYGAIAEYLGNKKLSRVVGNALHNNPDPFYYPCYKVVNAEGYLTNNFGGGGIEVQKARLENDGIEVIENKVDLNKYLYK